MRVIIGKESDKCGDEYLKGDKVEAEIYAGNRFIGIEVDGVRYSIPKEVFTGIIKEED